MKGLQKITPLLLTTVLSLSCSLAVAADSTVTFWKRSVIFDVTTTQTSYSDSWTGGEAGSVNWVMNLNAAAERKLKPWLDLRSTLKLSFGQTLTQNVDVEGKPWKKPKKSTDLIDWETVARFPVGWFVDPYVAERVESQFFDGSVVAKKRWLSPLKFTHSTGFARKIYEKEDDFVTSRLGFGVQNIFTETFIDTTIDFDTERKSVTEGGFESVTDAVLTLGDNLQYTGKLSLFKAVIFSDKDEVEGKPEEDYWKTVDVNFENIISASVSKIITVNLYTQLLYDKEIEKRARWKETLALGLVFKLL